MLSFAVILTGGCSGSEGNRSSEAPDASMDRLADASRTPDDAAQPGDAAAPDSSDLCGNDPIPTTVPAGWARWSDYDSCCGFYLPSSAAQLPAPIQWGPCDPSAQPAGIVCSQIVQTWQSDPGELTPFGLYTASWLQADGAVTLATARIVDAGNGAWARTTLIADADGPVRQAVFEATPLQCAALIGSVQDGMAVYQVVENNSDYGGGAFGGAIDNLKPTAMLHFPDHIAHEFVAGAPGIVDDATMLLYGWQNPAKSLLRIVDPADEGLSYSLLAFSGQALFWQAQSIPIQKEKAWTSTMGVEDLIAFGSDTSQGAADLGTDGHDLVWLQGSGRTEPSGVFPTVSSMTTRSPAIQRSSGHAGSDRSSASTWASSRSR